MLYEQNVKPEFVFQLTIADLEAIIRRVVGETVTTVSPQMPMQSIEEPLLSIAELTAKLSVSRDLIYRLRKSGKIPEYRVGSRKLFKLSEVLAASKSNTQRRLQ